jgi:hypothetical protein
MGWVGSGCIGDLGPPHQPYRRKPEEYDGDSLDINSRTMVGLCVRELNSSTGVFSVELRRLRLIEGDEGTQILRRLTANSQFDSLS